MEETCKSLVLESLLHSLPDRASEFSRGRSDASRRQQLFESNALAASPDYDRLSTIVDTYFKAPVEPYSQREFSLDAGLDMVVEFGKMYTILLGNWREGRRRDRWIEQNSPGLDTNVLINVTKTYERVVRQTAIRVEAIFDKVRSCDELDSSPTYELTRHLLDGLNSTSARSSRQRMCRILVETTQTTMLRGHQSALENLAASLRLRRVDRSVVVTRILERGRVPGEMLNKKTQRWRTTKRKLRAVTG